MKDISIIIGGDIVPIGDSLICFENGNVEALVDDRLLALIESADLSVFNLETPLSDCPQPISKQGPNLCAPTRTARGLKQINPGLFSLANNHILDQGAQGLDSTIKTLKAMRSPYFGAGRNLNEASLPHVVTISGKKIGLYACAEHEFSIASESMPGANPFNPLESLDAIQGLSEECDFVIVLYHGGKEHYRYPSPAQRATCRKIAEKGANLVVCQHSHCIGAKEQWGDSTIIYGQGNFLFDHSESEYWQTGLLVSLSIELSDGTLKIEYIPLRKQGAKVVMAEGEDASEIMSGFMYRSEEIKNAGFVEKAFANQAISDIDRYLDAFVPGSRTFPYRVLNRLFTRKLTRRLISKHRLISMQNYLVCESHRELFIAGIKELQKYGRF